MNDASVVEPVERFRDAPRRAPRVVICYPLVNPYMAACWRSLARRLDVDLFVIGQGAGDGDLVSFQPRIMHDVPSRLLMGAERADAQLVADLVASRQPDVLIISGWSEPAYRNLYFEPRLAGIPKILVMDNQFRRTMRQRLGRIALQPLLARVAHVWVTGERAWQYARYLHFAERRIYRGAVGVDAKNLHLIFSERRTGVWPRAFFFAGRYHERKAIDVMLDAFSIYRRSRCDPWPLVAAGMGPLETMLKSAEGVIDLGFLDPLAMRAAWRDAGVFVLASRYDAWPLAIVEAAATGLPVITTEECGSAVEVVRHLHSGYVVPTDDAPALASAMSWMHDNYERLPEMGERSIGLAAAFDAEVWAERAVAIINMACMPLLVHD